MDEFRPLPSLGWLWSLGFAVLSASGLIITAVAVALDPSAEEVPFAVWLGTGALIVPLMAFFLALAVLHPTMRYEFGPQELTLRFGPILRYRIPYTDVRGVSQRDLNVQMWSSVRWPGLALYKVPYAGMGAVRMCATRVNRGVVLIETITGPYGVSPAEPERFIDALRSRAGLSGR